MFFELSKDTDFDSIISKASLDVNTKKLIGKASKQDIIKSLHENMNSNNMPLYRKLFPSHDLVQLYLLKIVL